jgi:hypothetical protein
MDFYIGATVRRNEPIADPEATVIAVNRGQSPPVLHLLYAEGGQGYWPADAVTLLAPPWAHSPG